MILKETFIDPHFNARHQKTLGPKCLKIPSIIERGRHLEVWNDQNWQTNLIVVFIKTSLAFLF